MLRISSYILLEDPLKLQRIHPHLAYYNWIDKNGCFLFCSEHIHPENNKERVRVTWNTFEWSTTAIPDITGEIVPRYQDGYSLPEIFYLFTFIM